MDHEIRNTYTDRLEDIVIEKSKGHSDELDPVEQGELAILAFLNNSPSKQVEVLYDVGQGDALLGLVIDFLKNRVTGPSRRETELKERIMEFITDEIPKSLFEFYQHEIDYDLATTWRDYLRSLQDQHKHHMRNHAASNERSYL